MTKARLNSLAYLGISEQLTSVYRYIETYPIYNIVGE